MNELDPAALEALHVRVLLLLGWEHVLIDVPVYEANLLSPSERRRSRWDAESLCHWVPVSTWVPPGADPNEFLSKVSGYPVSQYGVPDISGTPLWESTIRDWFLDSRASDVSYSHRSIAVKARISADGRNGVFSIWKDSGMPLEPGLALCLAFLDWGVGHGEAEVVGASLLPRMRVLR